MIDYSRVKRVRVPEDCDVAHGDLTVGREYELTPVPERGYPYGDICDDKGKVIFLALHGCAVLKYSPWEILNPDTGEWEVAK